MSDTDLLLAFLDFTKWYSWLQLTGVILTVIVGGNTAWRKVIKPYVWKPMVAVADLSTLAGDFRVDPNDPNSKSLKQTLNAIDQNVTAFSRRLDGMESRSCRNEGRLGVLIQSHDEALFETNEKGEFILVNRAFCRMTGRTEHDLRGWNWLQAVCEDNRAGVAAEWNDCILKGRVFDFTFNVVRPDGSRREVLCKAHAMRGTEDKVTGWLGSLKENGNA